MIAPAALSHPHMFVDSRSELSINKTGQLTGLSTVMLIDELTTLYVLEENGVLSATEPLTDAQRAAIADGVVAGLRHYAFFTDLRIDGARLTFSDARISALDLEKARLAATLELTLETPQELEGRLVELALYDPTYFAAVDTLAAPIMPPALNNCSAHLVDFEPTKLDSGSLVALGALSREETPADPRIGARFADRSTIACVQ
ncbi:MAG: DUF1007 family protein [Rhodobacteraceae bacterium]|nr:DUF1007 family protein [Paracoccaceae bacterium]